MKVFTEEEKLKFIEVCESSNSMMAACTELQLHFNTFKKYAVEFGCYKPNQGGKGLKKSKSNRIKTQDILEGKYPQYQTFKLKRRLINEGYFEDKCMKCGWAGKRSGEKFTPCELHHKDGNRFNHSLDNLELLCPNCHSLTPTFRAKNIKN